MLLALVVTSSIFSSVIADAIGGFVVLVVGAAMTSLVARRRTDKESRNKKEADVLEQIGEVSDLAKAMHSALITAPPTPLNPFPPPGLIDVVAEVSRRTTRIEHTLFTNGDRNNTILDRLGRIETGAEADRAEISRKEHDDHTQ